MSPLTRRQLLLGTATAAAGAATTKAMAGRRTRLTTPTRPPLPAPADSGLDHIVVVLMENRSFDHYLGWLPGANTKQAGLRYPDNHGKNHITHHLSGRQGCGFNDPDHSWQGGHTQLNHGKMDGFRKGTNDNYALGYYSRADLPFYSALVDEATVLDHWFCSILSSTYPNRFYTHAARTDRLDNSMTESTLPTIWDSLAAAGVSANYYYSDLPFLALWGQKYAPIAQPVDNWFEQAQLGQLPSYSYLDPNFVGEGQGGSNDDHPHADILRGQAFVSKIANALINSPLWSKSALVVAYDEWGGFFEHVPPPVLPDDPPIDGKNHGQAGFRVPAFVLSPFARPGLIDHRVYDHTSILKMVEWRFGLKPLAPRDAAARNLARTFYFDQPQTTPPTLPTVTDPGPHICSSPNSGMAAEDPFWLELRDKVRADPAWRRALRN
jgi:phospholipase C